MASCNFRSSNRRCSECHSRQSEYTLDSRIPGRSGGHVSLRIRSTLQRATRTNAIGIRNRVADAEGDTVLERRDKKLIDVARLVGYESDAAFSKAFKRVVRANPGEYLRRGLKDPRSTEADHEQSR